MVAPVRPYLMARSTRSPSLGPEGRLAFRADLTGTMQLWTQSSPGRWPRQLTHFDERISTIDWAPDGSVIAFARDTGADEHDQLFTVNPDTHHIERLTDRPEAIHSWGCWDPDGGAIAFTSNRRERDRFDAFVLELDVDQPEWIAPGTGRSAICGWDETTDQLLMRTAHSSLDHDLFLIDRTTGDKMCITPTTDPIRIHNPTFGELGEQIYCLSDAQSDTLEFVSIDIASGSVQTLLSGDGSKVDGLAIDPPSGRFVCSRNVDGYSDLIAGTIDSTSNAVDSTPVAHPTGVIEDLSMGSKGEHVVFTLSATNRNYTIFVLPLSDSGPLSPRAPIQWTQPSPGGIPLERYHEPELVSFESFDGLEIPAYLSFPVSGDSNPPVIVDIHGGPHSQRRPSWRNRPIRQYLLDQGYALFEPNVRGSSGYGRKYGMLDEVERRMDSVRDIGSGVDWLIENQPVDPDRIVCWGRSYGGFMVLASITEYPELWAAAVEFVGIANWITFLEQTGHWRRSHREAEYGSLENDREFLESISPIHKVEHISCPLFIQHGENDPRVPVAEARQIAAALEERDIPVETCIFDDEGHHTTKLENRIEQFERIAAFLDRHVG